MLIDPASPTFPKYILRLSHLPVVVEADGRVWPVYLSLGDAARLFNITSDEMRDMVRREGIPTLRPTGREDFVEVAKIADWARANAIQVPTTAVTPRAAQ